MVALMHRCGAAAVACERLPRASGHRQPGLVKALALCLLVVIGAEVRAQGAPTVEEVETAYLHKFLAFVDWPAKSFPNDASPIVVGVAGSDRTHELLTAIAANRPVHGRPVEVRRLGSPSKVPNVHLVFVGKAAWADLPGWSESANGNGLHVVTDDPRGLDKGAALKFVQDGPRVRFEASLPAANQAGLRLSSRLLAVASRVVGSAP
jgi:hypothetical protein